jgi:hypothetical protein
MAARSRGRGSSRRDFLKGAGVGVVAAGSLGAPASAAAVPPAVSPRHPDTQAAAGPSGGGDFGRLFPDLPPFADASDAVRSALLDVGRIGGIMDAQDDLGAGAQSLLFNSAVNGSPTGADPYGTNPNNPTMTAGSTFVGQFVDHDITFDQTSRLGVPQNPLVSPNTRTAALDLDSVFGGGPGRRPDLYVRNRDGSVGPKLKIGSGGVHEDLPRVRHPNGTYSALLGDPRNDENLVVAGLTCAHILFYNRVLDELRSLDLTQFPSFRGADRSNPYEQFLIAREVTLWHYQWLTVNEHLPQIAGQAVVNDILRHGNRFYEPRRGHASIPIEFAAAAYRFGHSMVRPSYRANFTSGTGDARTPLRRPFIALVFDARAPGFSGPVLYDRDDLLGGFRAPRRYVGWQSFFDFGDGQVNHNKKIDTLLSSVLFTLPGPAIPPHTETAPTVLPQRDLLRQLTWGLPSGQAVAQAIGVSPLGPSDLSDIAGVYSPFGSSTPLSYYILAEAQALADGVHLGPVGGRIVAETLIGLLGADPTSYLNIHPRFKPFLGTDLRLGRRTNPKITGNRSYTRAHFLHYAGVVKPGVYR